PRIYRLRITTDRTDEREVDLQRGDRLIVKLVDDPSNPGHGIGFERALYGDEFPLSRQQNQGDWRLAVVSNQIWAARGAEWLRMMASLEPNTGPKEGALRSVKPPLSWFRLDAQGIERTETAFALRWHERIPYPAPVWLVDVPRWVANRSTGGPAEPVLRAWWWTPDSEVPSLEVKIGALREFQEDLPKDISDTGNKITIESLDIEQHPVEVQPGEPLQAESCLVVRLEFPKGSPYIVNPEPLKELLGTVSYEHRLYTQARKYTGLFWPVNLPRLQRLKSLSLI